MADDEDEEALYDTPAEFMSSLAQTTGVCNGQYIIRDSGRYHCHCTCGWDITATDRVEGLLLARQHTGTPTDGVD